MRIRLAAPLFAVALLSGSCNDTPAQGTPGVSPVTCSVTAIPCKDGGKTVIRCDGAATGVTGTVTYTWQCFHGGIGIPVCAYASPAGANQTCQPFEDEFQCTGPATMSSVELRCSGLAREQCSLIVEQDGVVSDPRVDQGRFVIDVSPACPANVDGGASMDGGASVDGGADVDAGGTDGSGADSGNGRDAG